MYVLRAKGFLSHAIMHEHKRTSEHSQDRNALRRVIRSHKQGHFTAHLEVADLDHAPRAASFIRPPGSPRQERGWTTSLLLQTKRLYKQYDKPGVKQTSTTE